MKGHKIAEHASPDADAIPWLLVAADSHDGTGVLSDVTFIQRINTAGGKAPTEPGQSNGQEARVHYSALYRFFGHGATTQPAN